MGSTRAGAWGDSAGHGVDFLASAAALRWARPDLTAAIADHVLETAAIADDAERWLNAAGWVVHARSATSDGRERASDVIESLSRWGRHALDHPAARRLRIELAQVAAGAGEVATARGLLGPVDVDETDPELRADLYCALARCAVEDAPERIAEALRSSASAWSMVTGPVSEVGAASVALISAVVERRGRRPDAAVDHAAEGLTRLERGRGDGPSGTPSGHLAAALAAEWIAALLDAGRADEARDGCIPLMPRLAEPARASRQLALLRLTGARAVATGELAGSSIRLLEQAAEDAAASDAPDLESVCRSALGALQDQMGQSDTALETMRLGVAAERRDRSRMARFRSALAELPAGALRVAPSREAAAASAGYDWESFLRDADGTGRPESTRTRPTPDEPRGGRRRRDDEPRYHDEYDDEYRDGDYDDYGSDQFEDEFDERSARRTRRPAEPSRSEPSWRDARLEPSGAESNGDWGDEPGDSPIGDLLFRNLRSGDVERQEEPRAGRRGRSNGHRAHDDVDPGQPSRNGRSRGTEAGGWHLAGDPREDRRGSRHRPDAGSASDLDGSWQVEERPARRSVGRSSRSTERPDADADDRWPLADSRETRRPESRERGTESGGGRRHRAETPPASAADDPEGWLRDALADLDRIWGTSGPGTEPRRPESRSTGTRAAERAGNLDARSVDRRCAVVIDVARDGRRFAGRRAGAVVRAVADRLADRLPVAARLRVTDSDALSISIPGWDPDEATEWMHRTLPGLLSGFDAGEDLPSAQLRAAVHDVDGPLGAEILRSLEGPPGRGRDRGSVSDLDDRPRDNGRSGRRHASDRAYENGDTGDGGGRRRRRDADPDDAERAEAGHGGSAAANTAKPAAGGAGPAGTPPESTEGLGIADLLAGALAAYRAI